MTEQFVFFWNGPFSQWHPSPFVLGGRHYNCAEQWMMASKALLFGDRIAYEEIMSTHAPARQKALGRRVKGFDLYTWNQNAKLIVYRGNKAKFLQNVDHLAHLRATAGKTIVEASPEDQIWGIGLCEEDRRARNRETWNGTNWLGEILTLVREDIGA